MLTHLHDRLVLQGDFDACEELIDKAVRGMQPVFVLTERKWDYACFLSNNDFYLIHVSSC